MKKYILLLIIFCLFITGCGKNNKNEEIVKKDSKYTTYKNELFTYEAPSKWEKYQINIVGGGNNTQILDPNTINDAIVTMIEIRVSKNNKYSNADEYYNDLLLLEKYIEGLTIRKNTYKNDVLELSYVDEFDTEKNGVTRTYFGLIDDTKFYIKFMCVASNNKMDFSLLEEEINHLLESIKLNK